MPLITEYQTVTFIERSVIRSGAIYRSFPCAMQEKTAR
ncbi:hypothetical protein L579_3681 [Pantoea sp. AS-PWVM4]|nr:hypothetical protein L579_3681 [Pantoea sp. AS-PWVM4]